MKKIKNSLIVLLCMMLLASVIGCGSSNQATETPTPTPKNQPPVTLTISVAASLKDSMDDIKKKYVKENPNVTININYGSSGMLEQQIEQGANVDIFMSAATKQMDALTQKDLLLEDTKVNLLGNKVVLIAKKDSKLKMKDIKDLSAIDKSQKLALGEPKTVPAGQYAEEILTKLNVFDKVKPKVVYAKDVKEVLTWVETGNADAGVVYLTDAKVSKKVKVVATAPDNLLSSPIVYPVAVTKASKNVAVAEDFVKYLSDTEAKEVFEKYGFDYLKK